MSCRLDLGDGGRSQEHAGLGRAGADSVADVVDTVLEQQRVGRQCVEGYVEAARVEVARLGEGVGARADQDLPVVPHDRQAAVLGHRGGHGRRLWDGADLFETGAQRCYEVSKSEEHTSELQSLMRNSYATFCLTQ